MTRHSIMPSRRAALGIGVTFFADSFARPGLCEDTPAQGQFSQQGAFKMQLVNSLTVKGAATAVAWSDDGSRLAAASNYGANLTVWDKAGRVIGEFDRSGRGPYVFNSLCFLDGGRSLVTPPGPAAPEDAALTIWNIADGKDLKDVPGPAPGMTHPFNSAIHFVLSPNGTRMAIAPARGDFIQVAIYDTNTWRLLVQIPHDKGGASAVTFSPDDRVLAVGTFRGDVVMFDSATGTALGKIHVFPSEWDNMIDSVAFSPNGKLIAVGAGLSITNHSAPDPVRILAVSDGARVASYVGVSEPIRKLEWVLGGNALAIVSNDKTVRIWNPYAGSGFGTTTKFSPNLLSVASSRGGLCLAVTDDTRVKIYHLSLIA